MNIAIESLDLQKCVKMQRGNRLVGKDIGITMLETTDEDLLKNGSACLQI